MCLVVRNQEVMTMNCSKATSDVLTFLLALWDVDAGERSGFFRATAPDNTKVDERDKTKAQPTAINRRDSS
jgi:hypothetical protein